MIDPRTRERYDALRLYAIGAIRDQSAASERLPQPLPSRAERRRDPAALAALAAAEEGEA